MVFDSDSPLSTACHRLREAQIIIADVSGLNGHVMYLLGLCHGLRRCPLLICQAPADLPFDLRSLRCIEYAPDAEGLRDLREHLTRAMRVFLRSAAADDVT